MAEISFSKNLKIFSSSNLPNEDIFRINLPAYVKSNGQEIFKPRVAEGIKNINKNNKLPIKPVSYTHLTLPTKA